MFERPAADRRLAVNGGCRHHVYGRKTDLMWGFDFVILLPGNSLALCDDCASVSVKSERKWKVI